MYRQRGNQHPIEKNVAVQTLQAIVHKVFDNAEESKYCMCSVCTNKLETRQRGHQFLRQSSSMFKIEVSKMKKFYQLLSAVDHKIFFKLQMPELCFFENGEGKVLFKTKGQAFIMVTLTPEMKKQIPNIFIDSRKANFVQPLYGDTSIHIKYFQSVVPSYKHGLANDNLQNKPKNYTFHSDERESEDKVILTGHIHPDTEVAIIKDKEKGLQLITEKQLRQILKSNVKTHTIQLIQGYVKPHERESQFFFSEYLDFRKPHNSLMFNRSLIQMKTEIGLISKYSKDYIPLQLLDEYEQMLKQIPQEYCMYQTYKMVHYIEINRDMRVKHLNTVWFKDEFKELNFFGVMQFNFEENQKVVADVSNIQELQSIMTSELTDLQKELLRAWEGMKKRKMHDYKVRLSNQPAPKQDGQLEQIKRECSLRTSKGKARSLMSKDRK